MLLKCLRCVTLAAFAVCALAVETSQRQFKSRSLLSRARSSEGGINGSVHETRFNVYGSPASRPPSCMRNTGISCASKSCDASRGEMRCDNGQCVCSTGCSSASGRCLHEANILVATGVRFQNAKWPGYFMVANAMDDFIHVTSNAMDSLARFNLYQLPGQGDHPQDFLLVPQGSPSHSLTVAHSLTCPGVIEIPVGIADGKKDLQNDTSAKSGCKDNWKAKAQPMSPSFNNHPSVQDAGVRLWHAPVTDKSSIGKLSNAITIRGSGKLVSKFLFVHDGSWKVATREDDPGLGGYWIPDPPLPFTLPMYDGPPCKYACSNSMPSALAGGGLFFIALVSSLS